MIGANRRRSVTRAIGLVALVAAAPNAAADKLPPQSYAPVNTALVDNHVVPRYERLAAATEELTKASEDFCANPKEAALDDVRARYQDTMDTWMGVQHLTFEPGELFMRSYRLYFWPQARGKVDDAVRELVEADDKQALVPERFRDASVAVQGLPALEELLFSEPSLEAAGKETKASRCALLKAITANTQTIAEGFVADWRGGRVAFAETAANPGPNNPYFSSHREVTLAFFKSLHGGLQLIGDVKLKPVLGEKVDDARPNQTESRLSSRGMRNIVLNLEALAALYRGDGGPGLNELVTEQADDAELDALLNKAFDMTLETARSIDKPLTEVVKDPAARPAAEKLLTQVFALKQIVKTRLATALDLTVGFNALDGD